MASMTKAELVEKMATDAQISKVAATAALNSFMDNVTTALKKKKRQGNAGWVRNVFKNKKKSPQGPESSNRRANQKQGMQCGQIQAWQKTARGRLIKFSHLLTGTDPLSYKGGQ